MDAISSVAVVDGNATGGKDTKAWSGAAVFNTGYRYKGLILFVRNIKGIGFRHI